MNAKRISCLFLAAVLTLGLVAGAISMLVSAEELTAGPTPTTNSSTENTAEEDVDTVDGDMIIFLILGVGVPVVMFAIILIKVNRR